MVHCHEINKICTYYKYMGMLKEVFKQRHVQNKILLTGEAAKWILRN